MIDLITHKWYKATHIFDDESYYNYIYDFNDDSIRYLSVNMQDWESQFIDEDMFTFEEDIFNMYEFEFKPLTPKDKKKILKKAFDGNS